MILGENVKDKRAKERFLTLEKELYERYLDKYDFSESIYVNKGTPINIKCNIHNEYFSATPQALLSSKSTVKGCHKCLTKWKQDFNRKPTNKFIEDMKLLHPQLDFTETEYITRKIKVDVICKDHGKFSILPNSLKRSKLGCPQCIAEKQSKLFKKTTEGFIEEAKAIFPQYDYSKVSYINAKDYVTIICKKHGEFNIIAHQLTGGTGCRLCGFESTGLALSKPYSEFIKDALVKFGDTYTYEEDTYKNMSTKMIVICKKHGKFEITPAQHLIQKYGCPKCAMENSASNYFDVPTKLYYIELTDEFNKKYYKIGITINTLKKRFSNMKDNVTFQVIDMVEFPNGRVAFLLEQFILNKFDDKRTKDNIMVGNGQTEVFDYDIYPEIKKYFDHNRKQEQE